MQHTLDDHPERSSRFAQALTQCRSRRNSRVSARGGRPGVSCGALRTAPPSLLGFGAAPAGRMGQGSAPSLTPR
jgi:hypothetical protein